MTPNWVSQEEKISQLREVVYSLVEKREPKEVIVKQLESQGLSHEKAILIVNEVTDSRKKVKHEEGIRLITLGALCLFGGIIITIFTFRLGRIFYISIAVAIYGVVQLFRGLGEYFG